ncbi:MAG: WD40 repeat domain-containing protein [Planctomycetes bacterium]|nr:WD40 repeat domain-containing protein [Planctomycetota bacterium]
MIRGLLHRLAPLWGSPAGRAGRAVRVALRVSTLLACLASLVALYSLAYLCSPTVRGPFPAAAVIVVIGGTIVVFVRASRTSFLPACLVAVAALAGACTHRVAEHYGVTWAGIRDAARDEWYGRYAPLERAIPAHPCPVDAVVIAPSGRWLATLGRFGPARLWSLPDASPLGEIALGEGWPRSMEFAASGDDLVVGNEVGASLFSVTGRTLLTTWEWDGGKPVTGPWWTLSPDGESLVLDCDQSPARVWSTRRALLLGTCGPADARSARRSRFTPDGRSLVTQSVTQSLATRVWSIPEMSLVGEFGEAARPDRLAPWRGLDARFLAMCAPAGTRQRGMLVLALPDGRPLAFFDSHFNLDLALEFSPDGRSFVAQLLDPEGRIGLFSIPEARCVGTIPGSQFVGNPVFSPDSRWVVVGPTDLGDISIVSTSDARVCGSLDLPRDKGSDGSYSFTPDSRILMVVDSGRPLRFWSVPEGRPLGTIGSGLWVTCATFSPDGRRVVTGHHDGAVRVWSVPSSRAQ